MVFSVFGYLDAAADTQWIRISPLRSTTLTSSEPPDALVTIEDLATGRTIELIPTLFTQISGEFDLLRYAHNFMTVESIDPLSDYRLTVERSDGRSSHAIVRTPRDMLEYPVVVGVPQAGSGVSTYSVRFPMEPSDHLAMVSVMYDPPNRLVIGGSETLECGVLPISSVYTARSGTYDATSQYYSLSFGLSTQFPVEYPCTEHGEWAIRIVRTVDPWPFEPTQANLSLSANTNIEHGIGFLGGLITRRIPVDHCELSGPGRPAVCELHFGPGTASLSILPANGWEYDPNFLPNAALRREGEGWSRSSRRQPAWNTISPILHFPGLLPGTFRVRLTHGARCEDRMITLLPDQDRMVEIEMGPLAPGESPNSDGCRERPL